MYSHVYITSLCIQEGLTDLVECGVGQCRTLRKFTMEANGHQSLSSSILKGIIQNPSLEQIKLWRCDFKGRFYILYVQNVLPMDLISLINYEDYVLYTIISIEWLCSVKCPFK